METRLRVRFADNAGFVCALPAGAALGDVLKAVGEKLKLSPGEVATLCCRDPRTHQALPDGLSCANLPEDDPDAPNLLRTVFVDLFAVRPGLLDALWKVPGASERFLLPQRPPKTTRAYSRLVVLNLVSRALSGNLFRGPDEARANAELVGLLAFYACGRLLQTSSGLEQLERFVRLAGLGQCAVDADGLCGCSDSPEAISIEIIAGASVLDYFTAHPLGQRWVFRAELNQNELAPPDRARLSDGSYDFHCTRAHVFLGENGIEARGVEGAAPIRVRRFVWFHALADAVFIEEERGNGLGICAERPRDLLAVLEKWAAWRQRAAI